MYYKKCIVLTSFVNSLTIMGTWCATYVSNIQATIVHPVDLQVSLKYFMTVIMLILKCMCIMTVQLCSNTYTHF
jgi:hypothetical protein